LSACESINQSINNASADADGIISQDDILDSYIDDFSFVWGMLEELDSDVGIAAGQNQKSTLGAATASLHDTTAYRQVSLFRAARNKCGAEIRSAYLIPN